MDKFYDQTCFEIIPKTQFIQQFTEEFQGEITALICVDLLKFALRDYDTVAYHQFDRCFTDYDNHPNGDTLYGVDNTLLTTAHADAKTIYDGIPIQTANYDLYHFLSAGQIPIAHQQPDTPIYFFSVNGCSHHSALTDTIIPWDLAKPKTTVTPLTELNEYFM